MVHPIHYYRPQRTEPEDLEAIFVAREPLLQEILERLARWEPGASRQHYLLIGPRGIGKSHLLQLIEHRMRNSPELSRKCLPVCFPEEQYQVTSVPDLLLEALRILAEDSQDPDLEATYRQLRFDSQDKRVTDLSLDALRRFSSRRPCAILLMVENVNRLLETQIRNRPQIHLLRKILTEEEWPVLICTSPTYLNAVTRPEEPLFEFFYVRFLRELSPEEQEQLLCKRASLDGNTSFLEYLQKYRSRLRALYHFSGGNPRLTLMLYDLVAHQAITDVRIELDLLLDQLTPFYQDRMKELAAQEAKVLEIMALLPEGCTPTELAQEARMDRNHVSTLLNRLESAGYIRREPRSRKKTVYIIPERFFRIWHQMSHSRSARGRVQYLLEFFSTWYATRVERDQVWNELVANFQRRIEHSDEEQMESVPALIERLKDESDDVRGSAAAALGRMGMEGKIPGLKEVAMALIETSDERQGSQLRRALTLLLRSAFRSGNLEMARAVVDGVASSLPDGEALCAPHQVALAYLDADRDPAILERQHPEVREAVEMLVSAFDQEREG